ncbi:MAG TPA: sulfotransferase [Tenuifilaceae bacterium]|nr:sulfotransferase [Tenuifilaceae bacterium]HPN23219.1 sulfotransferase [Tenuifilaceae bacterium]
MIEPTYILIGYCDRSGSTFLLNELNKIEGVVVCPELDLLIRVLLKNQNKEINPRFLRNFRQAILNDKKFTLWDIPIDSTGCKSRIDLFFKIIDDYSHKFTQNPRFIVFKERSILEYYKVLGNSYRNVCFVSLIRDPRAVFASQKRTINLSQNRLMSNNALTTARIWNRHCRTNERIDIKTITYERLISNLESTIQGLFRWIEKTDSPIFYKTDLGTQLFYNKDEKHILVSEPPIISRITAWEKELSTADIAIIEHICYDNMIKYQYEVSCKSRINFSKYILQLLWHWINILYWKVIVLLRKIFFMGLIKSQ